MAVLKLNSDLERIGDLASNIARSARSLAELPPLALQFNILDMSSRVKAMLRRALEALVNGDVEAARNVCAQDEEINALHRENHRRVLEEVKKDPSRAEALILMISVSRSLERIADHTTNISEDVVYMVDGDIIRHGRA